MSAGLFLNGTTRPKSKKAVKEAVAQDASKVYIEGTSMFGGDYTGPANEMPDGARIPFVGPDPYTARNYYGTISRKGDKVTVS